MNLQDAKVLFVFLEVSNIKHERAFLERELGFSVIENRFHPPHHRHGVVKYDAGETILALNLASSPPFDPLGEEGVVQVYQANIAYPRLLADANNHRFLLNPVTSSALSHQLPRLQELWLDVCELGPSVSFYRDRLHIEPYSQTKTEAYFAFSNVGIRLRAISATGHLPPSRQDGCLVVLHCQDVLPIYTRLRTLGVTFQSDIQESEIGRSVQFRDPSGHRFCLYQPSAESMSWESGPKVREIIGRKAT